MSQYPNQKKPQQPETKKKLYRGQGKIEHTLFKLKAKNMLKNVGYDGSPRWVELEHSHVYHTHDSSGKANEVCSAVGGHIHQVTVEYKGADEAPVAKCGPAMKFVRRIVDGKEVRSMEAIKNDNHTHECEYIVTEELVIRKINPEFAKVETLIMGTPPPKVEGVLG